MRNIINFQISLTSDRTSLILLIYIDIGFIAFWYQTRIFFLCISYVIDNVLFKYSPLYSFLYFIDTYDDKNFFYFEKLMRSLISFRYANATYGVLHVNHNTRWHFTPIWRELYFRTYICPPQITNFARETYLNVS